MRGKRIKRRKENRKIIKLFLVLILCYSLIQIGLWFYKTRKSKNDFVILQNDILINVDDESTENELKEESKIIDFEKLQSINSDTRGWLIIEKLDISYPIMQCENNEYYLKKNIYKENSISGSIFLDYRNNKFEDKNTILYGHRMKDSTMFGKLDNILEGKLGTDIDISIYTKDKIYKYEVFSAYQIKPKEFKMNENIDTIVAKSKIDFQKDIDKNSQYLTLYTCAKSSTERIIVHAVLNDV